jgi:hypothetical protein
MTGTIGAAAKVETKEMKNPIQDMWKDKWCGRWNEKMFKDIALFSLLFFLTSRRGEVSFWMKRRQKKTGELVLLKRVMEKDALFPSIPSANFSSKMDKSE